MKPLLNSPFIVNSVFFLFLFLPNNMFGSLIQVILTVFIILINPNKSVGFKNFSFQLSKLLFFFAISLAFLHTFLGNYGFFFQSVFKLFYLIFLVVFFPIASRSEISDKLIFLASFFIFFTQIAYIIGLTPIVNFIDTYYTSEGYFNSSEIQATSTEIVDLFNLRFGGIYRNSNQAGRIISLLFLILILNRRKKPWGKIAFASIGTMMISLLLTGSRTAFLVVIFILLYYLVFILKKRIIGFIAIAVIAIIPFVNLGNRILDFSELSGKKDSGSFTSKKEFLFSYVSEAIEKRPGDLVFGRFNIDNIYKNYGQRITTFDSEIGYLLHSVGLLGILSILFFYLVIFQKASLNTRMIFVMLLWSITSTVLTNFRFSLLFIFVLSLYYEFKESRSIITSTKHLN